MAFYYQPGIKRLRYSVKKTDFCKSQKRKKDQSIFWQNLQKNHTKDFILGKVTGFLSKTKT